jgi:hypothetical protein
MREPLSIRISDRYDPHRGKKLQVVLDKNRASIASVIRGLIDAYIESNGEVPFPVKLVAADRVHRK